MRGLEMSLFQGIESIINENKHLEASYNNLSEKFDSEINYFASENQRLTYEINNIKEAHHRDQ